MFRKVHPFRSKVSITVDGETMDAELGEPVAAALLRSRSPHAQAHPVTGKPRAPYCMMGICHDCLAVVDGIGSIQTCRVAVRDGMVVERQRGARGLPDG